MCFRKRRERRGGAAGVAGRVTCQRAHSQQPVVARIFAILHHSEKDINIRRRHAANIVDGPYAAPSNHSVVSVAVRAVCSILRRGASFQVLAVFMCMCPGSGVSYHKSPPFLLPPHQPLPRQGGPQEAPHKLHSGQRRRISRQGERAGLERGHKYVRGGGSGTHLQAAHKPTDPCRPAGLSTRAAPKRACVRSC